MKQRHSILITLGSCIVLGMMTLNVFGDDPTPPSPVPSTDDQLDNLRIVNVVDYGATPDINTDDDAASIQDAINAVSKDPDTRGIVFFPSGEYYIKETIYVGDNSAPGDETKLMNSAGLRIIGGGPSLFDSPTTSPGGNTWVRKSRGTLLVWAHANSTDGPMIKIRNQSQIEISNLSLAGNDDHDGQENDRVDVGIKVESSTGAGSGPLKFDNLRISDCKTGLDVGSTGEVRNDLGLISHCVFRECTVAVKHNNTFSVNFLYLHPAFTRCDAAVELNSGGNIDMISMSSVGVDKLFSLKPNSGGKNIQNINVYGGKIDNQGPFTRWVYSDQNPTSPTNLYYQFNFNGLHQSNNGDANTKDDPVIIVAPRMRVLVESCVIPTNGFAEIYGNENGPGDPRFGVFLARNCEIENDNPTSLSDMISLPNQGTSGEGDHRQWAFENCWNVDEGVITNQKSNTVANSSTAWPN